MKLFFGLFLCLFFIQIGSGQTKLCNLTVKDSPAIRGLKLGYSKQQIGQLISRKNVGTFTFLYQADLESLNGFENISEIVAIFDGQNLLDNLVVTYDPSAAQWTDAREFARNLSDNLNLPFQYWSFPAEDKTQATASCADFYIQITSSVNQVFVKALNRKEKIDADKRNKAVETTPAKRTFKP